MNKCAGCNIDEFKSHHILDPRLEVAKKSFGLMALDFPILDGFSSQEVIHLDCENGRRASLIRGAEITCVTTTTTQTPVYPDSVLIFISNWTQAPFICHIDGKKTKTLNHSLY